MTDTERLKEIWADFVYDDKMDESVAEPIADSWRKCKAAGVSISEGAGGRIDEKVLERVRTANRVLIETAQPVMTSVLDIVKRTGYLIVLTESAGYLLETLGDDGVMNKSRDLRFVPGAIWSNLEVGTNAISLALDYDIAIQTVGAQHYCVSHQGWTCSAAPIHGLNGEIIGCINMSGEMQTCNEHTLALVKVAALSIERQYSISYTNELLKSVLDTSTDAVVILDTDYKPFDMNSRAGALLAPDGEDIFEKDFRRVLPGINWLDNVWDVGKSRIYENEPVVTGGQTTYCDIKMSPLAEYGKRTLCLTLKKPKSAGQAIDRVQEERIRIREAVNVCEGNVEKAAAFLGMSRATLYRKLKDAGINPKTIRKQ